MYKCINVMIGIKKEIYFVFFFYVKLKYFLYNKYKV